MNILYAFEEIIKKYKALFFDKIKEKTDNGWKIVYNIQGLNHKNTFYSNLKFVFWFNKEQTELSDDVITYLYRQNCEFKSQLIKLDVLEEQIDAILEEIKNEKSNSFINNFIVKGTDEFNLEAKKNDLDLFFDNIAYKPSGNSPCVLHSFKFDLSANDVLYTFDLKCGDNKWEIIMDNETYEVEQEDVYKKIVEVISENIKKED